MQYRIIGTTVPAVEIKLSSGEAVYTQSGGMAWRSDGIAMDTNTRGGFMKGLKRAFSGESMFMVTYSAYSDSTICFSSTVPGSIMAVNADEHAGMILQKGAFLCAENNVELSTVWRKGIMKGLFGGEGFIMQRVECGGTLWLEIDGDAVERELAPDELLMVDTGNVVAFDSTVTYDIERVKGFKNIFLGGEGLFVTTLKGPGKVILQTQNLVDFARRIGSMLPTPTQTQTQPISSN